MLLPLQSKKEKKIIFIIIAIWVFLIFLASIFKYYGLQIKNADHGQFYYLINQLKNNCSWMDYNTDFAHRFATHTSFILVFFVPFLFLWDSVLMLSLIQAIVVGLGAFAIYKIALHYFPEEEKKNYRVAFVFSYLGFVPLLKTVLYDFDPIRMAPTFLLFFLYYVLLEKNDKKAFFWLLLLFFTRETLPLVVMGTGLYLLVFEKEKKRGIFYLGIGLFVFLFLNFMLMPYFRQKYPSYIFQGEGLAYLKSRYDYIAGETLWDTFLNILKNPLKVLSVFFTVPSFKWINFLGLFFFLLAFPFLNLRFILISLFITGVYYLSHYDFPFTYKHQYFVEIFPPLFFSFISGVQIFIQKIKQKNNIFPFEKYLPLIFFVFFSVMIITQVGNMAGKSFFVYTQHKETIDRIFTQSLDLKNETHSAFFVHNRLTHLFGHHPYLTVTNYFNLAYPLYQQDKNIKNLYFIGLEEKDFGDVSKEYQIVIPKLKQEGFEEIYRYKQFFIYKKTLRE